MDEQRVLTSTKIDGLANAPQAISARHARNRFAKIIHVISAELVLNFPEVDIFACVHWANMAITASTVSDEFLEFLISSKSMCAGLLEPRENNIWNFSLSLFYLNRSRCWSAVFLRKYKWIIFIHLLSSAHSTWIDTRFELSHHAIDICANLTARILGSVGCARR